MGARAYRHLALYDPAPGCLIEVGSERGEGSTAWLHTYAQRHSLRFYTADIDPSVHQQARTITAGARLMTGAELLRRIRSPISIAYLDGFDWTPKGMEREGWILEQRCRYRELGLEMTNKNSQAEQLAEALLVTERAAASAVVICDDTWHNERWDGKGGLAVPHLLDHGFRVVDSADPDDHSLGYVVLRR